MSAVGPLPFLTLDQPWCRSLTGDGFFMFLIGREFFCFRSDPALFQPPPHEAPRYGHCFDSYPPLSSSFDHYGCDFVPAVAQSDPSASFQFLVVVLQRDLFSFGRSFCLLSLRSCSVPVVPRFASVLLD